MNMNKNLAIIAIFFVLLTSFRFAGDKKEINFIDNDWKAAKDASKAQDKPIFVFLYTSTCQISARMKDEVFTNPKVATEFNDKFICVMMDMDAFQNQLHVNAWKATGSPTWVFLDKNRDLALKESGFKKPDEIIALAEQALKKY